MVALYRLPLRPLLSLPVTPSFDPSEAEGWPSHPVPPSRYDQLEGAVLDRRTFLGVLTGSLLAAPLAAEAQQAGKVPRVGYLTSTLARWNADGNRATGGMAVGRPRMERTLNGPGPSGSRRANPSPRLPGRV